MFRFFCLAQNRRRGTSMTLSIRGLFWLTAILALLGPAWRLSGEEGREDSANLSGTWRVELMQKDGSDTKEAVGESVLLKDGVFEEHLHDGQVVRGTYVINRKTTPWRINVKWNDSELEIKGIVELKANSLSICMADAGDDYPSSFKTKKGDGRCVFFYKRVAKSD